MEHSPQYPSGLNAERRHVADGPPKYQHLVRSPYNTPQLPPLHHPRAQPDEQHDSRSSLIPRGRVAGQLRSVKAKFSSPAEPPKIARPDKASPSLSSSTGSSETSPDLRSEPGPGNGQTPSSGRERLNYHTHSASADQVVTHGVCAGRESDDKSRKSKSSFRSFFKREKADAKDVDRVEIKHWSDDY